MGVAIKLRLGGLNVPGVLHQHLSHQNHCHAPSLGLGGGGGGGGGRRNGKSYNENKPSKLYPTNV